jgi:mono/diheme cytochrome c family protein
MRKHLNLAAFFAAALALAGCRSDMQNQPKYNPLRSSVFWADGRSARDPVEGTVSRTGLREDPGFYTGKVNGKEVTTFPLPVTPELLARGQERFEIYCTPCHSRVGDGNGMIVQRGLKHPPSYHEQRLKDAPIGHFVDVMTNGFGAMLSYSQQITPEDRWAVAAYIRALQLSQSATVNDVPAEMRGKIAEAPAPPHQGFGEHGGATTLENPNPNAAGHQNPQAVPATGEVKPK